jgi:hypothetical protein
MAVVGVGLFMLLLGGLLGYLIADSNAKPGRTQTVVASGSQPTQTQTTTAPQNTTTVTTSTTVSKPGKTTTRVQKVTTPAKTVTVASPAHTVTVKAATTVTHTQTVTASTSSSATGLQTFNGSSTQNLGTIHVAAPSQLRWSCPGCSSGNFTITNSSSDPASLSTQAQGTTSGQLAVSPATYTSVTVQGTGSWSITITPQG